MRRQQRQFLDVAIGAALMSNPGDVRRLARQFGPLGAHQGADLDELLGLLVDQGDLRGDQSALLVDQGRRLDSAHPAIKWVRHHDSSSTLTETAGFMLKMPP